MVDKTLEYVDYLKLLEIIQRHASTGFIREQILDLRPLSTLKEIEERQERIEGVLEIIKWHGPIPLGDIPDIRNTLSQLSLADFTLEIPDFLAIARFLTGCRVVAAFLKKALKKGPYIESMIEGIKTPTEVSARIKNSYIAIRNGRYVIPLKPNYNQFFQGIVHDYSHSLKTSFVEPIEIIEVNNSISVLEKEEGEEEKRVLRELTRWTRHYVGELGQALSMIADLDFHLCLALFASAFHCVRPRVETGGSIEIRGALNPFIVLSKGERAVPIDILIGQEKLATIVSGPNADGKTVALKTAGLLLLMASAGLFVPARETPRVSLFPRIYAIMGDEQDIAMELSTFTAHVEAVKQVFDQSLGGELVLIDEIGGGTEPQEASALSMGIIDAFAEKGCKVIVTTHLNLLKAYGATRPFALNVATDFDPQTMKPLYRLLYGMAGVSNALKVAEKSGLPREIVEKSYSYLGKQEYVLNDLIAGLEKEKKEAEEERRQARVYREEMRKRLETLKEKRDEYLKQAEERCQRRVTELEAELDQIAKDMARRERGSVPGARAKVSAIRKKLSPGGKTEQGEVRVGDYVRVRTMGKEGYVTDMDEPRRMAEIVVGNMRMRIKRDYVEKVSPKPQGVEKGVSVQVADIDVPEINVRGLRVEEALEEVDRFVDRAIVHGTSQLRILHGIGTGRLMNAIRDHLSEAGHVKDVKKDERNSGVTIVELL